MALKKSEKRMLIILGIVVVIVIIFQIASSGDDKQTNTTSSKPSIRKAVNAPDKAVSSSVTQAQVTQSSQTFEERKTFDSWGDNPFSTSSRQKRKKRSYSTDTTRTTAKKTQPKHKFLGIFVAQGNKYALIDDLVIAEGQTKEGIKVVKIEGNSVTCIEKGKKFSLYWSE